MLTVNGKDQTASSLVSAAETKAPSQLCSEAIVPEFSIFLSALLHHCNLAWHVRYAPSECDFSGVHLEHPTHCSYSTHRAYSALGRFGFCLIQYPASVLVSELDSNLNSDSDIE